MSKSKEGVNNGKDRLFDGKSKRKNISQSWDTVRLLSLRGGVEIGRNCLLCSSPMTREPYLINIGNNVTVSTNVTFVTHDNSIKLLYPEKSDIFGKIVIGNNCFIGENVTILYGVTLADNIIVAAGSVVTKSFRDSNIIIGGNPAHIINTWDKFSEKIKDNVITRKEMENCKERDSSFLISR